MRLSRRTANIVIAAVICCFLGALIARPVMVAHHRFHMARNWKAMMGELELKSGDNFFSRLFGIAADASKSERHEYHRDQLVYWGELAFMEYRFRHLEDRSPEYQHLWRRRLLPGKCPQSDPDGGLTGSYSEPPKLARLQIWCKPAHLEDWRVFLTTVDVPDYRQRFMEVEDAGVTRKGPKGRKGPKA